MNSPDNQKSQRDEILDADREAELEQQHSKSYASGYKDGWRDGRHELNNPPDSPLPPEVTPEQQTTHKVQLVRSGKVAECIYCKAVFGIPLCSVAKIESWTCPKAPVPVPAPVPASGPSPAPLSKCCRKPLRVHSADEGTQSYVCTVCGNFADEAGPSAAAMEAAREILALIESESDKAMHPHKSDLAAIIDRKFPREEDGARLDWLDTLPKHGGWHISVNGYGHPHVSDAYHGTSIRAAIDSARAALQDSREGK